MDVLHQERFLGLAYAEKEGSKSSFLWGEKADYRSDPTKIKILPRTLKVSGTVVQDLILDGDRQSSDAYFIGNAGHIYKRASDDTWTDLRTVSGSHGNGCKYFGEDSYFYYASDKVLGRYGPFGGTKTFVDDFLGAEGGVPTNTYSLDLELSSSQYATAADSASLSITGDITLEANVKWESLPAVGAEATIVSKWNENGNQRSYYFGLYGISSYFGDGSDGALTISTDTTHAPTDSACTGTSAAYTLAATNPSFATGQKILIHQSRGTNAGRWERNEIASYTAGTITLTDPLDNTYTSGAQVLVLKEYTDVTVNSGKTWTAKAWNGTVGGILAFLASGTVTVTGTISATGKGFRGGTGVNLSAGKQGEGHSGAGDTIASTANGSGAGGGGFIGGQGAGGGGGGGHAAVGSAGTKRGIFTGAVGAGGEISGSADLTTLTFGGGGGSGGAGTSGTSGAGGTGGGIIFIIGATTTITGSVIANGNAATAYVANPAAGSGGGAGGSVLIKAQVATLGTTKITATGGSGGVYSGDSNSGDGGAGATGRVHLDYYTSYTGTTSPTLNATQDDNLVTSTTYQLRLSVCSTDGASGNVETLAKTLPANPQTAQWYRYAVKWDASASTAYFNVNSSPIGTSTGTKTAMYDSTALFAIGASFDSATGAAENFLDGKIDDVRVWNDLRTDSEVYAYKEIELVGTEANLQAYWQLDNAATDSTANANTLTLVNTPVYSTDVPFSAPTTRRDLDQSLDTSGQTYTLATTIGEGATHRQSFVPAKDPQKSIEVLVAAKGTGDWTLTVHDGLNREIVSKTIVNANVVVGDNEFVFSSVWRPVIGATYHFHLTSTVADGTVTTTTTSDLETVDFHTYYQFLVEDVFHPMEQITNKLAIGNERYLATWDGITYTPHKLTLPSGYRIRCLGTWREYLVMGVVQGTNIEDYDQGWLFFWDGYNTTYNFYVPVPQGGINAILNGDPLYFVAGYSADFMKYEGGKPYKIRRMPDVKTSIIEVNRKAIAMWRALVHLGMAMDSTSTTIKRGVYSYGSLHAELPETLSFDYPLSLGITQSADLEIGMLFPIGSSLFISWRNGTSYGVDSVTPTNSPYASARIEFLISDAEKIWAEKQAQVIRGYFKKLASGDGVKLEYKIDRNDNWTVGSTSANKGYATTADEKEVRLSLPTKGNRFNEFQVAVNLETTNTTSPEFYGFGMELEKLTREQRT